MKQFDFIVGVCIEVHDHHPFSGVKNGKKLDGAPRKNPISHTSLNEYETNPG